MYNDKLGSQFWRLEIQNQDTGRPGCKYKLLSAAKTVLCCVFREDCPNVAKGKLTERCCEVSDKGLDSTLKGGASCSNQPLNGLPLNSATLTTHLTYGSKWNVFKMEHEVNLNFTQAINNFNRNMFQILHSTSSV